MATYTNTVNNDSLDVALGSPTLVAADVIRLNEEGVDYNDDLEALGGTAIDQFFADPPFNGAIGNGTEALLCQSDEYFLRSASPSIAIKGNDTDTTELLEWNLASSGVGYISLIDTITKVQLLAGGLISFRASAGVTNLYARRGTQARLESGGSAATLVSAVGLGARVYLERDSATVNAHAGGHVSCDDDTATPGTVNCFGGRVSLRSGTVTITCGGEGTVIDLRGAKGTLTITWVVLGDVTILEPPSGITVNYPSASEIGAGKVTRIPLNAA